MKNKLKLKSYAQYGEDSVLFNFFQDKFGENYKGIGVEVGALDGFHLSNTFLFENLGWKCICIEAHPTQGKLCEENRPASLVINKAVSNNAGEIGFKLTERGSHSCIAVDEDTKIKCDTLDNMLNDTLTPDERIDFITIDIDGSEEIALEKFDIGRWKPRIVIMEMSEVPHIVRGFIEKSGYHHAIDTGINTFIVRDLEDVALLRSVISRSTRIVDKILCDN